MAHFRCPTTSQLVDNPRYSYANEDTLNYIEEVSSDDEQASSSSSSTILAPRTRSSLRKPASTNNAGSPLISSSPITQQHSSQHLSFHPQSLGVASNQPIFDQDEPRRCWICFGEDTDSIGKWVKPCPCSLIAHEKCLLDWITENQKTSPTKSVQCPQCASTYQLVDYTSWSLALMGVVDEVVHTVSPYLSALGFGLSLLVVSTTYGVSSVLMLFGVREGERILGSPSLWTWRMWLGLPAVPFALLSTQTRWADSTLPFATILMLRASTFGPLMPQSNGLGSSFSTYALPHLQISWPPSPLATLGLLPWVRLVYNNMYYAVQTMMSRHLKLKLTPPRPRRRRSSASFLTNPTGHGPSQDTSAADQSQERNPEVDILLGRGRPPSFSAIFTGTLLWPMIGNLTGSCLSQFKWIRDHFPEPFHRNVLGGCLFVVVRDIGGLIYRYQKIRQYRSRRICNYSEIAAAPSKDSRRPRS